MTVSNKQKETEIELQKLAKQANQLHQQYNLNAFHIGKILSQAKEKLRELGEDRTWEAWVTANCVFSKSMARYYKRVYEIFKDHENDLNGVFDTLLIVLTRESFPPKAVDFVLQNPKLQERGMVEKIKEAEKSCRGNEEMLLENLRKLAAGEAPPSSSSSPPEKAKDTEGKEEVKEAALKPESEQKPESEMTEEPEGEESESERVLPKDIRELKADFFVFLDELNEAKTNTDPEQFRSFVEEAIVKLKGLLLEQQESVIICDAGEGPSMEANSLQ